MYVLDTNILSEYRKISSGKADRNVTAWQASVPQSTMYLSVVTVMELEIGTLLLEGRDPAQSKDLRKWLSEQVMPTFASRVLPIDASVALRCAQLHVPNWRADRDAFIAATALVHGMAIVTRNVTDFATTGAAIVNPWNA